MTKEEAQAKIQQLSKALDKLVGFFDTHEEWRVKSVKYGLQPQWLQQARDALKEAGWRK